MSDHYEWAVLTPESENWSGIYTMGPSGPRDVLTNGDVKYATDKWTGEDLHDDQGEPVVESVRRPPEGSYVGRRVISAGPWEVADDERTPPSRTTSDASKGDVS